MPARPTDNYMTIILQIQNILKYETLKANLSPVDRVVCSLCFFVSVDLGMYRLWVLQVKSVHHTLPTVRLIPLHYISWNEVNQSFHVLHLSLVDFHRCPC